MNDHDELTDGKNTDDVNQTPNQEAAKDATSENARDNLFTRGKDEPNTRLNKISGAVCGALVLIGIAVYVLLGILTELWHPYWVILVACVLGDGIVETVFNLCDGEKRKSAQEKGVNPYIAETCKIIMHVCIIAYLLCGALANLWHPCWFILIIGVVADAVIGVVGKCISSKNQ